MRFQNQFSVAPGNWFLGIVNAAAMLLFAGSALAADVTFTTDTPVTLDGSGIDLTILSGSNADAVVVDTTTVTVTVSGSDTLTIQAPSNNRLENDQGKNPCSKVSGVVTMTITSADSPIVITPSATICSTSGGGGGGGGGGPIIVPGVSCTVTSPNGGETLAPGTSANVLWTSSGSGINNVELLYSSDAGLNWHSIAAPEANDGSYLWTVPAVETTQALVRVDCRDAGGAVLATDHSDADFTISSATTPPPPPPTPPPAPPPSGSSDSTMNGAFGPNFAMENNPDIGTAMGISGPGIPSCPVGRLVKSTVLSTVYWCGGDGFRYSFPNEGTYFSWYADFSNIIVLSPAQLAATPLKRNVIYRPGLRMLKIVSDPRTYAVARGGTLRWIESEAVARALYGASWAKYVSDVSDAFFSDYVIGRPITLDDIPFGSAPPPLPSSAPACSVDAPFTQFLSLGSNDPEVLPLQQLLQCLGYIDASVPLTGHFGPATESAVKAFQSDNGLEPAGYVGPGTRAALNTYVK